MGELRKRDTLLGYLGGNFCFFFIAVWLRGGWTAVSNTHGKLEFETIRTVVFSAETFVKT